MLPPALHARSDRAGGRTCACITADDFADHRAAGGAAQARTGRRAGCRGRWLGRGSCLLLRLRRIDARLSNRPLVALVFVLLLLLGRLALGWIDELLRLSAG